MLARMPTPPDVKQVMPHIHADSRMGSWPVSTRRSVPLNLALARLCPRQQVSQQTHNLSIRLPVQLLAPRPFTLPVIPLSVPRQRAQGTPLRRPMPAAGRRPRHRTGYTWAAPTQAPAGQAGPWRGCPAWLAPPAKGPPTSPTAKAGKWMRMPWTTTPCSKQFGWRPGWTPRGLGRFQRAATAAVCTAGRKPGRGRSRGASWESQSLGQGWQAPGQAPGAVAGRPSRHCHVCRATRRGQPRQPPCWWAALGSARKVAGQGAGRTLWRGRLEASRKPGTT